MDTRQMVWEEKTGVSICDTDMYAIAGTRVGKDSNEMKYECWNGKHAFLNCDLRDLIISSAKYSQKAGLVVDKEIAPACRWKEVEWR